MNNLQYHIDDRKAVLEIDKATIKKYWNQRHEPICREILVMALESAKGHRDMIVQLESPEMEALSKSVNTGWPYAE